MSVCPTPAKQNFPSRNAAKAEGKRATKRYSMKGQLRPYLCECGDWHLTHLTGKDAQLARRKRRRRVVRPQEAA